MTTDLLESSPAQDGGQWATFTAGYEAGIRDGIQIGRAQMQAEEWPIWQQFTRHVRALVSPPGPIGYSERQAWIRRRQEQACQHAGWTPQQIREHAATSWGLTIGQQQETMSGRWTR